MKILTYKSFSEAIKLCQDNERYRILIVAQDRDYYDQILKYLDQFVTRVVNTRNSPWVEFYNGSIIRMLSASSNMIGQKANLVLCDADFYNDCEEIRYILPTFEMNNSKFKIDHKEKQHESIL